MSGVGSGIGMVTEPQALAMTGSAPEGCRLEIIVVVVVIVVLELAANGSFFFWLPFLLLSPA